MLKRNGPKRVSVFEAGAGKEPLGIITQALRATRKRPGRSFVASDIEARKEIFRDFGLRKMLPNAKILKGDSLEHLAKEKTASRDVVFGSYFIASFINKAKREKGVMGAMSEVRGLFSQLHRVLKPNGRAIFIIDLQASDKLKAIAPIAGFRANLFRFKPRENVEYSDWIMKRLTKSGREELMETNLEQKVVTPEVVAEEMKTYGVTSADELCYPYVLVLRKSKE
ncbi:MAG: class I SAM-dependent methyltransferase [archaeon]|jgi:hypothetical protein